MTNAMGIQKRLLKPAKSRLGSNSHVDDMSNALKIHHGEQMESSVMQEEKAYWISQRTSACMWSCLMSFFGVILGITENEVRNQKTPCPSAQKAPSVPKWHSRDGRDRGVDRTGRRRQQRRACFAPQQRGAGQISDAGGRGLGGWRGGGVGEGGWVEECSRWFSVLALPTRSLGGVDGFGSTRPSRSVRAYASIPRLGFDEKGQAVTNVGPGFLGVAWGMAPYRATDVPLDTLARKDIYIYTHMYRCMYVERVRATSAA